MKNKSPAFQFYPQDFLSSLQVQTMTTQEVGAYILLLANSWIQKEQCMLPDDENVLRILSKLSEEEWKKSSVKILSCFEKKDGKIYNERLLEEKRKQVKHSKTQSLNGQMGGRPQKSHGFISGKPNESQTKAQKSSSSSISSSSSSSKKKCSNELFLEFYKIYPKKKNVGQAEKAWSKIQNPVETLELIKNALEWQIKSEQWTNDGGLYIPYPASYLNGKSWLDEKQEQNKKTTQEWI